VLAASACCSCGSLLQPAVAAAAATATNFEEWFRPYNGVPGNLAPSDDQMELWRNRPKLSSFPSFDHASPKFSLVLSQLQLTAGRVQLAVSGQSFAASAVVTLASVASAAANSSSG